MPAMIEIRKSEDRGLADHGWLRSYHTFSSADYYDPENMGFGNPRLLNSAPIHPVTRLARPVPQEAHLCAALADGSARAGQKGQPGRRAYVHVARGRLTVNGQPLEAGDALKATNTSEIVLEKGEGAEVLLFDLA